MISGRQLYWIRIIAGATLFIPGLIHLLSFSDTVSASALAFGDMLALVAASAATASLLVSGALFIFGKYTHVAAAIGIVFLLFGSFVHVMWAIQLSDRVHNMPEGLTDEEQLLYTDTIAFASNAQIPHVLKNIALIALLSVFVFPTTQIKKRIK